MNVQVAKNENHCLVRVEVEKLLSSNSPELKGQFLHLKNEGFRNIITDLSSVRYVDSSGLSSLLVGNRLFKEMSGCFVLTGLNPHISKLIKISQLESILTIVPTIAESVDYISMEELEKDLMS